MKKALEVHDLLRTAMYPTLALLVKREKSPVERMNASVLSVSLMHH